MLKFLILDRKEKKYYEIFDREFLPHIDALKTFAYHLSYNESDANDLVQETYLKAFRFIDKYDEGTNAKAWLFKILKNAYINEYRKMDLWIYDRYGGYDHTRTKSGISGGMDVGHFIYECICTPYRLCCGC